MNCKKLKKSFTAVFLSGCLLLQNFPVLAASVASDWLKESPFIKKSDLIFSSEPQTEEAKETLASFSQETEDTAETESAVEASSSHVSGFLIAGSISDKFSQMLQEASPASVYTTGSVSQDISWKQLKSELTSRINSYSSKWSLYLKDLSTGNVISINEGAQESASLIKLYVMGAVMQEIQNGNLEMNDTISQLLDKMITISDNEATNELVRYLDSDHEHKKGMQKVNDFIRTQGFEYTQEYNGLEDTSLWYSIETKNSTSAKDCGRLLERIYRGEFVSHLASHQMEELLLKQEVTYKIPSTIPSESHVANKTGETSDCENDAAIIYTPKGDYILCIMSCDLSSKSSAVSYLQEMSSLIYRYFMDRDESKIEYQIDASATEKTAGSETEPETETETAAETETTAETETISETEVLKNHANLGKNF